MLKRLIRQISSKVSGGQSKTPTEIRELIDRQQLDAAWAGVDLLSEHTPNRDNEALCLRGDIAFRRHDDAAAEAFFRQALADAPGLSDAHYGLALIFTERGDKESALRHAQFAVNTDPTTPRFYAQLGLCQLEMGNYTLADKALSHATRLAPEDKASWNNLGISKRARGDIAASQRAFRRALEIDPTFERAAENLKLLTDEMTQRGTVQRKVQTSASSPGAEPTLPGIDGVRALEIEDGPAVAIERCNALCLEQPDQPAFVIELDRLYQLEGDPQSGLDALEAFHVRFPQDARIAGQLGKAFLKASNFKRAKPLLVAALEAFPQDVPLLLAMADVREEQNRYADAGALIERAFAVDSSLHMKGRLVSSLVTRCRYADALALIDEMLAEEPSVYTDLVSLRVYSLTHLGRHDEALPVLDREIEASPYDPNKRFPRATIHLLNERFAQGWDDYAYRNLSSTKHLRMLPFPQWKGEPLEGKSIIVLAEQGLGDQVMFASCLPDLLQKNPKRVIVEAIDRVAPTLARSFPQCRVIATRQDNVLSWVRELGEIDYFIPIADLPQLFRRSCEDFPQHQGYLRPDAARVEYWRKMLGALGAKPKIGLSWRGGTELTRTGLRSMDILQMASLSESIDADLVCLQYGDVSADLAKAREAGFPMHCWPAAIANLDDFAALIGALDLVITVCNTTVHYAGALGKPVWVLSPKIPEWRYGLFSSSLPWYPSSRMYRQHAAGDWSEVIDRVRQDAAVAVGSP